MRHKAMLLFGYALEVLMLPAAAAPETAMWQTVQIPAARQLDLRARASGHEYRLFISVPTSPAPKNGFPVFYALDGNAAFPVAAFLARSAASRSEVSGHIPPIVVGIGYPGNKDFDVAARRRDYTLARTTPIDEPDAGGADRFLDFIENEVKPLIAENHPVDRNRQAIFGHSFGGLFVLHALLTRPASFSSFIASSPSIWWQDKALLDALPALLQGNIRPRVQISVGSLEDDPPKGKYPPEMQALITSRKMLPPARELAGRLGGAPDWADKVAYHELQGEDHGPAWLPAMSRGMQFFLEQP